MAIQGLIPKQNFEIVRDQIGALLKLEISAQIMRRNLDYEADIYVERTVSIQDSEDLVINIQFESSNYGNFNEKSSEGETTYLIDVYSTSKKDPEKDGGYRSNLKTQRVLGWIRSILMSTEYKTLGIEIDYENGKPAFIAGTYVQETASNTNFLLGSDVSFLSVGRVIFMARLNESQQMESGVEMDVHGTRFLLHDTELGYKIENSLNN